MTEIEKQLRRFPMTGTMDDPGEVQRERVKDADKILVWCKEAERWMKDGL